MKTLSLYDKDPNEISCLVEQFFDTGERPIQIFLIMNFTLRESCWRDFN